MKKRIIALVILLLCALVYQANAASYYGCASAAINADSTFCTTATGSCTGETPVTAATALAGTHTLYANGCTISIPENITVTAAKLSNKDDGGDMVDGGQFTTVTNATPTTLTAALEAGGTESLLAISGTAVGDPVTNSVLNIVASTITGGSANNIRAIYSTHTVGAVYVTTSSGVTGGSNSLGSGIYWVGATPTANAGVTVTGNCSNASGTAPACEAAGNGLMKVTGDCIGSDSAAAGYGCKSIGTSGITVTGNIVNGLRATGTTGLVTWIPSSAEKYVQFKGGTDVYASQAPDKAKVLTDTSVVVSTTGAYEAGTATGGGGAYGW